MRVLTSLFLILCFACVASAQDSQDRRMLDQAARNGTGLTTITVNRNVSAQAVLIPQVDARRIFGKEIADNYAVIEVNVGNKSSDAALIIHGIFIDYTHWALSGTPARSQGMIDGLARESSEPFQASTNPNQIASEEYRVVRGQLLDAQLWSKRNWTLRLLTFAGSLAGAITFPFNERGVIKSFNVFSGVFVPGVREAWPDGTIEQLNRVSDFGYQANKVIPRQGAEVIVCFFPIDRFLTPGFKKLFQKSPALFFSPLQMLVDKSFKKEADDILRGIDSNLSVDELRGSLPCYLRVVQEIRFGSAADSRTFAGQMNQNADATCRAAFGLEEATDATGAKVVDARGATLLRVKNDDVSRKQFRSFMALDFISQMSLNTVSVTVDGVMTVDTTNIAAKIDDVKFDSVLNCGDDESSCFWARTAANGGVRTGTLPGSYLTGGSVAIAEAGDLGITELRTLSDNSTDQALHFSFKLTKPIPPDTLLHFIVSKVQPGAAGTSVRTVNSLPREYRVGYTPEKPKVKAVTQDGTQAGSKLTVTGADFLDAPPIYPLVVKLVLPGSKEVEVKPTIAGDGKTLTITIPDEVDEPGCWQVKVGVGPGGVVAAAEDPDCTCFVIMPKPTISEAVVSGNFINVTGEDLIDTATCSPAGKRLRFQLVKEGATAEDKPVNITRGQLSPTGKEAVLELPAAAKTGKWNVHVLLGSEDKGNVKLDRPEQ